MNESTGLLHEVDVTVVVVTWNSERWIASCLDALPSACAGLEWECVVIDNASSDDSAAIAESHVGERGSVIRCSENLGFAGGVNRGFENASGHCTFLLNPDCVMDPGSVKCLLDSCEDDPSVAGAAPVLRGSDGSSQARFQFRRLPTVGALVAEALFVDRIAPWEGSTARYRYRDRDFTHGQDVEQPAFAAVLLRSRAVKKEGPLDESFHPAWFDDVDYCKRLFADGYHFIVVPEATGVHVGGSSLESMHRGAFAEIWYANMMRYARKWFSPRGATRLRLAIMLGMMLRITATAIGLGKFEGRRREVLRGWINVLKAAWSGWETTSRSS